MHAQNMPRTPILNTRCPMSISASLLRRKDNLVLSSYFLTENSPDTTKYWMWRIRNPPLLLVGRRSATVPRKTKLNILLSYDPAITFFGVYQEVENLSHTKTCTWRFITALFTTAKTCMQPRWVST
jgi:hypothetical protein